ncbi:MAG: citrate synthase [Thermodesulfobacteriota bacterium]|nr:MAG: citrate synthase [Thermodesulfobacteriota bacterium]
MDERLTMDVVPGLEGIPAAESAISFIDGEKGILEYRGIPVEALAEKSNFVEVAYFLLFGHLPKRAELEKFRADITFHTRLKLKILRMMEYLPENGHPMHYLQAVTSAMGMYYPARDTLDPETRYWSCVRLIAKLPTIVAAVHRLKHGDAPIQPRNDLSLAASFYYMLLEKEPSPVIEKILDSMLVLHADHTMNASTFSARVVGSTLADPYTVVSSAIGTLSGPLHGGANEAVVRMLDEIGPSGNARAYIEGKLRRKEKVMGVGHRIYKTTDPRGEVLKGYIARLAELDEIDKNTIEASREIEAVVMEELAPKGLYPNIDFYSGILFRSMGIPTELFTPIFAMGRVVGWLAHWMEQLNYNRIYRPEQKYTGLRSRPYIPMEERE